MSIDNEMINLQNSTATLQSNVNAKKPVLDTAASNADTAKAQAAAKAAEATDSVESIKSNARSAKLKAEQAEASAIAAEQVSQGIATALPKVKPTLNLDFVNNKTFDSRIDFTRSTTATYYDGKTVAKAEENLHRSVELISVNNMPRTLNATVAPDGTTTAVKFVPTSGADRHSFVDYAVFPKTTYWFSIYLKAAEHSLFRMSDGNSGSFQVGFDLSSGEIIYTNGSSYLDSSITDAGNGWYRCAVKLFRATGVRVFNSSYPSSGVTLDNYSPIFFGDDVSGVYAWGAQVEERDFLTAYTPTTGSPITNYIPVLKTAEINEPRIDHDPVSGKCKGFLMEESRTNISKYSEDFSNALWLKSAYSLESNSNIAPNGTQTADLLKCEAVNQTFVGQDITLTTGAYYTLSLYAKANTTDVLTFRLQRGPTVLGDLNVTLGTSEEATHVGNGWYRISFTTTTPSDGTNGGIRIYVGGRLTQAVGDSLFLWGMQVEQAPFATSYIPTNGSAVTRSMDSASVDTSGIVDASKGTFYASWTSYSVKSGGSYGREGTVFSLHESWAGGKPPYQPAMSASLNNRLAMEGQGYASASVMLGMRIEVADFYLSGKEMQGAFTYKVGEFCALSGNGLVNVGYTPVSPFYNERLHLSKNYDRRHTNHIRKITYYPDSVTTTELQALTQE